MNDAERVETIYNILSGEDDSDRLCEAIPEEACTDVPRNYLLNVLNGSATKWAEQLAGPNLVLPWLLNALGVPAYLLGLLMPLKQTGSLLPQLAIAGQIRQFSKRKWIWVGAGLAQAIMLFLMIPAAIFFPPIWAGVAIVVLLALFSIASGMGSVAFQDVVGKTIPKGRRGSMLANRAISGGILTISSGIVLKFWIGESEEISVYLVLVGFAAFLWALAAFTYANISELPGATAGGRNFLAEFKSGLHYLTLSPGYRRYLYARATLVSIEIATPFYVLHAQKMLGKQMQFLAILVVAVGLAKVLSSRFWGRFADISSRRVMIYSGLFGVAAGGTALLMDVFLTSGPESAYIYSAVFLLIGLAEAGVRLGRKTYLIDATSEKKRPTYVAFANTTIGAITLLLGFLGVVAEIFSIELLIAVLIFLALSGSIFSARMPEADDMIS